jgi:hypothetical protein
MANINGYDSHPASLLVIAEIVEYPADIGSDRTSLGFYIKNPGEDGKLPGLYSWPYLQPDRLAKQPLDSIPRDRRPMSFRDENAIHEFLGRLIGHRKIIPRITFALSEKSGYLYPTLQAETSGKLVTSSDQL